MALLACGLAGCAPTQQVPLRVGPGPVEVYVDGERLVGEVPESIELRANRSHIIMVKREGYRSRQVALQRTRTTEGYRLLPAQVNVSLRKLERRGRSVEVELEDPGVDDPGDPQAPAGVPAAEN